MWYPEEPITYCSRCDLEVPADCFWRGRGLIINEEGDQEPRAVLYSVCPECGLRQSTGLDGPWWYRALYHWMWRMRYPRTRPPRLRLPAEDLAPPLRRRRTG